LKPDGNCRLSLEKRVLVGHYALGLIAKRVEPGVNLAMLVLAAMFADFAWCIFMIFGLEHVQLGPGMGAGKYFSATNIELSHSLVMDALWATIFGLGYLLWRRSWRQTVFIFILVLSHWLLDVISHGSDMPIAPGIHWHVGLGLWKSITATLVIEGGLWCLAILLFVRVPRTKSKIGSLVFFGGIGFITFVWLINIAGPPPQNPAAAPFVSLTIFCLTLAWAYWVDQVRLVTPAYG
jgi:membrane-bound metal-dependent hydrolase YbcI (DUF457 family)